MRTAISTLLFSTLFPHSTSKGSDCSGINQQKIRLFAERGLMLKQGELIIMMEKHHQFLAAGGAGGKWKVLQVGDIVVGFYETEQLLQGQQAIFERMNLSKVDFQNLEFPFANFCGAYAEKLDAQKANLSYSLMTDMSFAGANFAGANLSYSDFSRSVLRGVNFKNANLSGADFENCDLREADFSGAKFDSARFPGAKLDGVLYE